MSPPPQTYEESYDFYQRYVGGPFFKILPYLGTAGLRRWANLPTREARRLLEELGESIVSLLLFFVVFVL